MREDAENEPNCKPYGRPDYDRLASDMAEDLALGRSQSTASGDLKVVELGNEASHVLIDRNKTPETPNRFQRVRMDGYAI
jgi:hypothetical protein